MKRLLILFLLLAVGSTDLYAQNDNSRIYYTSSDGLIVKPNKEALFDAHIVSNTYEDGVGVICFDGPITVIDRKAFYNKDVLSSIIIPNSVTYIGDDAFWDCENLTSITIPNSVTEIGDGAFRGCTNLTSVTIPNSVTYIGDGAFYDCENLASITIPNGVTEIGIGAFFGCDNLASITIPNSVTSIGSSAFYDCKNLTSIVIPNSVASIGEWTFGDCGNLKCFYGKFATPDGKALICNGKLISYAHGNYAKSYNIPNGVTEIGEGAFCGCESLASITIPNSVTSIGESAFCGCESLASVTIGKGVTSIGHQAFLLCVNLKKVYCKATTPPNALYDEYYWWGAFGNNASELKIYVPRESVEAYKSAIGWKDYASAIVGYDF